MMVTGMHLYFGYDPELGLICFSPGDHPKTAEAIARKINLILPDSDTKETLAAKTGRPIEEIYEDEVSAVVIHGDTIDSLQGWQWDQSALQYFVTRRSLIFSARSLQQAGDRVCKNIASTQT